MEEQVFNLLDMYSTKNRDVAVGQVVYSPNEVQALVDWARENPYQFESLARRYCRRTDMRSVHRAMNAWGFRK